MAVFSGTSGNDTLGPSSGSTSDTLYGGAGNDTLFGGGGTDTLFGGEGADSLNGGTGADTASYASATSAVNANLTVQTNATGEAAGDTYSSIENLTGSSFNDTLTGNGSANTLTGGDGDDTLIGLGGSDSLVGGNGNDTVDYSASGSGVTVNLSSGPGTGGDADGDTFSSIENVTGSALADNITGTGGNNTFFGGLGNDQLFAGSGDDWLRGGQGSDTLNGGSGMDYADYSDSGAAVSINLGAGTASGGTAQGDVLSGVDGIVGSIYNDTLIGFDGQGTSGDIYTNIFYGGTGDDYLDGRGADDTLFGGADNDTVYGSAGEDSVSGDGGNDSVYGGTGNDTVSGGDGNDIVEGGEGNDTLSGDGGNDSMSGDTGNDTMSGGDGNDRIDAGEGADSVSGGDGADSIAGQSGDDTLDAGIGDDTVYGGDGSDTVYGGEGNDIIGGGDATPVPASETYGTTVDSLYGGGGDDTIFGGNGRNTIFGGDGNDTIFGGNGPDTIFGEAGNDVLNGNNGPDELYGGTGNDTLTGGNGPDLLDGGDDQDRFIVASASQGVNDTVYGGAGGADNDVLDLSQLTWGTFRVVNLTTDTDGNGQDGRVEFLDSNGNVTGSMNFNNIEQIVPCFTPGTTIATTRGAVAVEELRLGDRVMTRDNGYQTIRWIGAKKVDGARLARDASLQPVLIRKDAFGPGCPERDMMVSRQHRMLVGGRRAELLFGETEMLARATHLTHLPGIVSRIVPEVTYLHILFDQHEIVRANNCWTESFQPGDRTVGSMDKATREELFKLFPELASSGTHDYEAARPTLKGFEAKLFFAA